MSNWFEYKGISSEEYPELIVQELPSITKPKMRSEITYVDGVDGARVDEIGYCAVDKTMKIGLISCEHIDEILSWLTGSGNVTFSNEPNRVYTARILDEIDYNRLGRFKTASVKFLCQPYKLIKDEENETGTAAGTFYVYNNGTINSLPLVEIVGTGTVTVTLNGTLTCTLAMGGVSNDIMLDSEAQNAYNNTTGALKNSIMTGDFPQLIPGMNTLVIAGTVTSVTITPRSRFI